MRGKEGYTCALIDYCFFLFFVFLVYCVCCVLYCLALLSQQALPMIKKKGLAHISSHSMTNGIYSELQKKVPPYCPLFDSRINGPGDYPATG